MEQSRSDGPSPSARFLCQYYVRLRFDATPPLPPSLSLSSRRNLSTWAHKQRVLYDTTVTSSDAGEPSVNMTEAPGIRRLYVGTMPFIIIIYYRGLRDASLDDPLLTQSSPGYTSRNPLHARYSVIPGYPSGNPSLIAPFLSESRGLSLSLSLVAFPGADELKSP